MTPAWMAPVAPRKLYFNSTELTILLSLSIRYRNEYVPVAGFRSAGAYEVTAAQLTLNCSNELRVSGCPLLEPGYDFSPRTVNSDNEPVAPATGPADIDGVIGWVLAPAVYDPWHGGQNGMSSSSSSLLEPSIGSNSSSADLRPLNRVPSPVFWMLFSSRVTPLLPIVSYA